MGALTVGGRLPPIENELVVSRQPVLGSSSGDPPAATIAAAPLGVRRVGRETDLRRPRHRVSGRHQVPHDRRRAHYVLADIVSISYRGEGSKCD